MLINDCFLCSICTGYLNKVLFITINCTLLNYGD